MPPKNIEGWPPAPDGRSRRVPTRIALPPFLRSAAPAYLFLVVLLAIVLRATGNHGFAIIEAEQVGVVVNYVTGDAKIVNQPGFRFFLPFVERVYTFDKTTQEFRMQGNQYRSHNHTPLLTVRASDGSNFRIDDLTILYEVIPGDADVLLQDSGPGTGFKEEWIKAYARSILRDEFGRYTAVEVADPNVYKQATAEASQRLSRLLEPHGMRIVRINTPNPQFDAAYEGAIEERKEADQEVERLIAEALRLEQLRAQRLSAVNKEKEVEKQQLEGDLKQALLLTQEQDIQLRKEADVYATSRMAAGRASLEELTSVARGLEAKYRKEAEGIVSRTEALAQRGEVVVREALIEKLLDVRFTLLPYSRDSEPKRLEHADVRDPARQSGSVGGDDS